MRIVYLNIIFFFAKILIEFQLLIVVGEADA